MLAFTGALLFNRLQASFGLLPCEASAEATYNKLGPVANFARYAIIDSLLKNMENLGVLSCLTFTEKLCEDLFCFI